MPPLPPPAAARRRRCHPRLQVQGSVLEVCAGGGAAQPLDLCRLLLYGLLCRLLLANSKRLYPFLSLGEAAQAPFLRAAAAAVYHGSHDCACATDVGCGASASARGGTGSSGRGGANRRESSSSSSAIAASSGQLAAPAQAQAAGSRSSSSRWRSSRSSSGSRVGGACQSPGRRWRWGGLPAAGA